MTDTRTRLLATVTSTLGAIEYTTEDPLDAKIEDICKDSLDIVDLIMCVEDEFGITISDEEADVFTSHIGQAAKTLRDLHALVDSKVNKKVAA